MKRSLGTALLSLTLVAACNVDSAVLETSTTEKFAPAKMDISMKGSSIAFDGNPVQLGQSLLSWKKAIPAAIRCTDERVLPVMCTWDQIGLQVGTDDSGKNVKFASLFLLDPKIDLEPLPSLPDGTPAGVSHVPLPPKFPFLGRLQLDGVDITRNKQFSQVRDSIDKGRRVRCRISDCSLPHGSFGNGAQIFFELDGSSETNTIARIGLSLASEKF